MKGARDKTHAPEAHDAYFTIDGRVIPALLRHMTLRGNVWEPAGGKGHMVRALEAAGYRVYSSDLVDHGVGIASGIDFLKETKDHGVGIESIVTNPPNNLNLAFALHGLKMIEKAHGIVALYQRHEWDTTQKTAPIFDHPAFAMKIVCRFRPRWFEPRAGEEAASPFHKFSWYVWDWRHSGRPVMVFS